MLRSTGRLSVASNSHQHEWNKEESQHTTMFDVYNVFYLPFVPLSFCSPSHSPRLFMDLLACCRPNSLKVPSLTGEGTLFGSKEQFSTWRKTEWQSGLTAKLDQCPNLPWATRCFHNSQKPLIVDEANRWIIYNVINQHANQPENKKLDNHGITWQGLCVLSFTFSLPSVSELSQVLTFTCA